MCLACIQHLFFGNTIEDALFCGKKILAAKKIIGTGLICAECCSLLVSALFELDTVFKLCFPFLKQAVNVTITLRH